MAEIRKLTKKKTKIVCTMGPATEDDKVLRQLILAGMNVARFNFSHGSHEYHRRNIERVRALSRELNIPVAIMLDTKGPEIRTGELVEHEPVMLEAGSKVVVTTRVVQGTNECFSVDYENLPSEMKAGSTILVDDGLIELKVDGVDGHDIFCSVVNGGMLGEKKGVNIPNTEVGLPNVTDQDVADIMFGCELGIDAIAASFIRNGAAVDEIRKICAKSGAPDTMIFSKIESAIAVKNFDEILAASDGIMVARGDLGVELPAAKLPHIQKLIIRKCNDNYKPVITATQMLDSMIHNPRPTRAEVTDVANAIYDGTDCVMLSGETAAGMWPVQAVKTMSDICKETERYLDERHVYHERGGIKNVNSSIGFAAVTTAERVGAQCILCPTHSGRTARLISTFKPSQPFWATSPSEVAIRRTCFNWGCYAFLSSEQPSLMPTLHNAIEVAKANGVVKEGDIVVLTAGDRVTTPRDESYTSSTNMLMVAQVD
ncbi:MAG: pyruvate kinase [Atopobiaceae bacterium]|nr:pyruvate kinase [Atopobiaceae bacterium]